MALYNINFQEDTSAWYKGSSKFFHRFQ